MNNLLLKIVQYLFGSSAKLVQVYTVVVAYPRYCVREPLGGLVACAELVTGFVLTN